MKKTLALTMGLSLLLSGSVFASPQVNFEKDKVSVDIAITNPELETSDNVFTGSTKWNKKTNFDFGITSGMGNNFALQYKYQSNDADVSWGKANSNIQELNLLYKIDEHVHAFAGLHQLSGDITIPVLGTGDVKNTNRFQLGITALVPLNQNLNGWATVAAGDDNNSYEVGLSHPVSENTDLNVFYRYKKFKNLEIENVGAYRFEAESKGLGFGLTMRF